MKLSTHKGQQAQRQRKTNEISLWNSFWQRKTYYLVGFIISICLGLLCMVLGSRVDIPEIIIISLSCSYIFGFLIFIVIKEPGRLKKEGRFVIATKEGFLHIGLTLGTLMLLGVIWKLFKYFL